MPSERGPTLRILLRGLAGRCPACGVGRVFVRGLRSERTCSACGWRLERGLGHWVGGTEINMLATFTASVAFGIPLVLLAGPGPFVYATVLAFTAAFSVASYRATRSLFFAIDYLVDPVADASSGLFGGVGGGGGGDCRDPRRERPSPRTPRSDPEPQRDAEIESAPAAVARPSAEQPASRGADEP